MSELVASQANRNAYSDIENMASFTEQDELQRYREYRIKRYQPVVGFVSRHNQNARHQHFVEIGSGSSALLYALYKAGLLASGTGIELSTSRHNFAQAWKEEHGYSVIENINADFSEITLGQEATDWYIVIDNTFTYLEPENRDFPDQILEQPYSCLKKGGRLLLDFINYAKREVGRDYQQWVVFPESDPYSYGLYSNRIDSDGFNQSISIYIKRDGTESQKVEYSGVYSQADIEQLVMAKGFVVESIHADFNGSGFQPDTSDRLVLLAIKS
jgi:SAM-dependent methyltransferase